MTASQDARFGIMTGPPSAVRACRLIVSEWTKLRSARSTYLMLLFAAGATLALSSVLAAGEATQHATKGPPADPLLPTFIGLSYALVTMGFFGVFEFTSEHATGLIRTTFAAVPRRRAVLAAKAAVAGVVTLVLGELLSFATFFLAQAILSGHHRSVSLSHPGVLGAVMAEGTFLFLISMMGTGLGAIVRHTAGAVAALLGLLAAPAILLFLPASWSDIIGRFTPLFSAEQVIALHPRPELFSPALSMAVLVAWPAAVLIVAAILISRRDV
jgi:ABC-2 type transport system permease protein